MFGNYLRLDKQTISPFLFHCDFQVNITLHHRAVLVLAKEFSETVLFLDNLLLYGAYSTVTILQIAFVTLKQLSFILKSSQSIQPVVRRLT